MPMLESPLFRLGLLSLFHIIGGSVVGATLRKMRQAGAGGVPNQGCLFVWGIMFAGIPLMFGVGEFVESRTLWLLPAQITVLLGTILVTFLWGAAAKDLLNQDSIKFMGGGGVFMIAGAIAVSILFHEGEWWMVLIFGVVFIGIGALLFIKGLQIALKEFAQLDRDESD